MRTMKKRAVSFITAVFLALSLCLYLPETAVRASALNGSGYNYNYTITGNGAADIVAIAKVQTGKTGYNLGFNYNWCAAFVSDCAEMAGQSDAFEASVSSTEIMYSVLDNGGIYTTDNPLPGDLIIYANGTDFSRNRETNDIQHIEIVTRVEDGIVYSLGGNTGSGKVSGERRVSGERNINNVGFSYYKIVRPNYSGITPPILPTTTVDTYNLPQSFYCDDYIHVYDCYGNYQSNHYIEPDDYCTIDAVYNNGYVHLIYPISGVDCGDYYGKLEDFEKWLKRKQTIPQGSEMSSGAGQTIPDGDYIIVSELGRRIYLDIPDTAYPAPEGIDVAICNGTIPGKDGKYDTWTVTYLGDGYYKINQNGTNVTLDVKNASLAVGTEIMTHYWHGGTNQQWSIAATDHGYTIQSRSTGWYLDVRDAGTATGTKVQTCGANGSKAQSWCFIPVASDDRPIEDGKYYIKSAAGNAYLDADGDYNYTNGANIQIWGEKTDSYDVTYVGDGYYKIIETTSGLALDVYDGDASAFLHKNNIQLWEYNTSNKRGQLWKIVDEGNGYYRLVSKLSGYSLDLAGMKTDDGSNVQSHPYNTSNAQKWSFEKVHEHSYTASVIAPTCTEKGYTLHKCECGNSYTDNETAALGHKTTATAAKAATCIADGNTAYWYCSNCKKYFSDAACTKEITLASTVIKATGHSFGKWKTVAEPTASAEGKAERECSVCHEKETKVLPKIVPATDAKIIVQSISAQAGKTVTVDISLKNNPGIVAAKLNVSYDSSVMTLTDAEEADYSGVFFGPVGNKPFVIGWSSASTADITADGVFARLTFEISGKAAKGEYPITVTLSKGETYNVNLEDVDFAVTDGAVTVRSHLPGDVNDDGEVNMKDVTTLQRYLVGWDVKINPDAADCNGGDGINMKDLTLLQRFICGWDVTLA